MTDNIEMRLCREDAPDEDTPVEIIEIYVQWMEYLTSCMQHSQNLK